MTYIYKSNDDPRPMPTRYQVQPTHILITPQGRRIEVNAGWDVIKHYVNRPGWTVYDLEYERQQAAKADHDAAAIYADYVEEYCNHLSGYGE